MTRGIWLLVLSLFVFAVVLTTVANAVEQTGDLNTNTSDSTVDSNNKSTTNNYNGAGAASKVTPPPSAIAPSYIRIRALLVARSVHKSTSLACRAGSIDKT